MKPIHRRLRFAAVSGIAALLAACGVSYRTGPDPAGPQAPPPGPVAPPAVAPAPVAPPATAAPAAPPSPLASVPPVSQLPAVSYATTARAYRRDAATHLYAHNRERIFKGMLRPNLYAVGVLDVDIDRNGQVTGTSWRRAPKHAPEVMAEIIRTVRGAAPYPAPSRMGRVTYSDVWLWDKSGQFQLDTLTEGQL